jgi:hypothetical protein
MALNVFIDPKAIMYLLGTEDGLLKKINLHHHLYLTIQLKQNDAGCG